MARILLISDIHANLEALDACLDEAPEHDHVVNLGDIVGYGASPNEVVQRSRKIGKIFVRGNHDKACSGISNMEDFNPVAGLAVIWTRTILSKTNLEWLRALPEGPAPLDGFDDIRLVHGSPRDEDEYLLLMSDAMESLEDSQPASTFFGHTHVQGGFFAGSDEAAAIRPVYKTHGPSEKFVFKLRKKVRYLINPGSIGQPRDGDWRAAFALFDSETYCVTYYRVKYDVQKAQKRILEADLPERLATRLAQGR
jgi:predicted phosphodiesterase